MALYPDQFLAHDFIALAIKIQDCCENSCTIFMTNIFNKSCVI